MKSLLISLTAVAVQANQTPTGARFWWDGFGFRVYGNAKPSTCSASVCSTDEAVGCQVFKCLSREDVRAIPADQWFTADWEMDWWYRGPGEGAWMLKDIVDGVEDWQWIATLNPIPKEVQLGDSTHVINHGVQTFMAQTAEVVPTAGYGSLTCVAAGLVAGMASAFLAARKTDFCKN